MVLVVHQASLVTLAPTAHQVHLVTAVLVCQASLATQAAVSQASLATAVTVALVCLVTVASQATVALDCQASQATVAQVYQASQAHQVFLVTVVLQVALLSATTLLPQPTSTHWLQRLLADQQARFTPATPSCSTSQAPVI